MDILQDQAETVEGLTAQEDRWTISDDDERERLELEHRRGCTFESYLLTRSDRQFTEVMRALEVIKTVVREYNGPVSVDWVLGRLA